MYKDYFDLKYAFASINYLPEGLKRAKERFYDKKYYSIYELQKLVYNLGYVDNIFKEGTNENIKAGDILKLLEETIANVGDIISGENIINQLNGVNGFLNNINQIIQQTTNAAADDAYDRVKDYTTQLWNRRHLYQHPPQIKQGIAWEICKTGDELRRQKPKWRLIPTDSYKRELARYVKRCDVFIAASKQLLLIYDKYTVNNETLAEFNRNYYNKKTTISAGGVTILPQQQQGEVPSTGLNLAGAFSNIPLWVILIIVVLFITGTIKIKG